MFTISSGVYTDLNDVLLRFLYELPMRLHSMATGRRLDLATPIDVMDIILLHTKGAVTPKSSGSYECRLER